MPNKLLTDVPEKHNYDTNSKKDPDTLTAERYEEDTKNRTKLATLTMWIIITWLAAVITIIVLNGCMVIKLTDTVICVLLGTTTANVLGLSAIVLKGYFRYMSQDTNLFNSKDQ